MVLSALPPTAPHHGSVSDKNQDDSKDKDGKGPQPPRFPHRRVRFRCRICGAILNPLVAKPSAAGTQPDKRPLIGIHRYRSGGLIDCPFASHPYALPREVNRMIVADAVAAAIPFTGHPAARACGPARRCQPPTHTTGRDDENAEIDDDDDDKGDDKHDNDDEDDDDDDDDGDDHPLQQATGRPEPASLCSKTCGKN